MCNLPSMNMRPRASKSLIKAFAFASKEPLGVTSNAKKGEPLYIVHSNPCVFVSSKPRKRSCGVVTVELNSETVSSSAFKYGSSPIRGRTSLYDAYSSLVGSFANGARLFSKSKEVEGCFNAADKKE